MKEARAIGKGITQCKKNKLPIERTDDSGTFRFLISPDAIPAGADLSTFRIEATFPNPPDVTYALGEPQTYFVLTPEDLQLLEPGEFYFDFSVLKLDGESSGFHFLQFSGDPSGAVDDSTDEDIGLPFTSFGEPSVVENLSRDSEELEEKPFVGKVDLRRFGAYGVNTEQAPPSSGAGVGPIDYEVSSPKEVAVGESFSYQLTMRLRRGEVIFELTDNHKMETYQTYVKDTGTWTVDGKLLAPKEITPTEVKIGPSEIVDAQVDIAAIFTCNEVTNGSKLLQATLGIYYPA